MATIVGGIATSRVPHIGAIANGLQQERHWKPFFDGFPPIREWLAKARPDVAVVIYNDHGLNFLLDKMPTFAVGAGAQYRSADDGWGIAYRGEEDLSRHMIESLIAEEFDITACQKMYVDHAFTLPLALLWPGSKGCPVRTVPVSINTVQFPLPTAARCFKFGQAIGRAVESWEADARVVVVGTGGLSHRLEGERAVSTNKEFDSMFMEKLVCDPLWVTRYSIADLIERTGEHGVELLMWLTMRGTLLGEVVKVHSNNHLTHTAPGLMVIEGV